MFDRGLREVASVRIAREMVEGWEAEDDAEAGASGVVVDGDERSSVRG
jgi:hypothetical protein